METLLSFLSPLSFVVIVGIVSFLVVKRVRFIKRNISLGKPLLRTDQPAIRLKNMLLKAFGQQKMFDRPLVGAMHALIYAGFLLINLEVVEIIADGFTGKHRLFAPFLGEWYGVMISFFEFLALGVVIACAGFFARRNMLSIPRFKMPELKGFPQLDANTILIWEVVLMFALFKMNAADAVLQTRAAESSYIAAHYPPVGSFAISSLFIPFFEGYSTAFLLFTERFLWWLHIIGILAFAVYITYSKHLHILLAFPNTYFANLDTKGKMTNMPEITKEVKVMLGEIQPDPVAAEIGRFGAKDVQDLTWKNLMDAYTCTECGRCSSVCPASMTGKKLSPRKVMMDTRDRVEEVGKALDQHKDITDKSLYGDYISKEELLACTSCNACVEACPVEISPLDIILQMRRYVAMEEAATPQSWNAMFANIENNGAPWAFSAADRFKWAEENK